MISLEKSDEPVEYELAVDWILRKIIEIIIKNPSSYSITINQNLKISSEAQIILQLLNLAKNPEIINNLIDKIIEIHQNSLDEDFYLEYLKLEIEKLKFNKENNNL